MGCACVYCASTRQGADEARSRMGDYNCGWEKRGLLGRFWGGLHTPNPQERKDMGAVSSVAEWFTVCNARSTLLSQPCFVITRLSFTVIFVFLTHLFPFFFFFFAWISLSFLSLGCHKFTSVTHRINVPLSALGRRDWHPPAPRQKSSRTRFCGLAGYCDKPTLVTGWGGGFESPLAHAWGNMGCPGCAHWLL